MDLYKYNKYNAYKKDNINLKRNRNIYVDLNTYEQNLNSYSNEIQYQPMKNHPGINEIIITNNYTLSPYVVGYSNRQNNIIYFTDGSFNNNSLGSFGFLKLNINGFNKYISKISSYNDDIYFTNNSTSMELQAIIDVFNNAIKRNYNEISIFTDSLAVINKILFYKTDKYGNYISVYNEQYMYNKIDRDFSRNTPDANILKGLYKIL